MQHVDYSHYVSEYGGEKLSGSNFSAYEKKASAFVDMITFHRLENAEKIPNCVKDAVCAVAEYMQGYDQDGGALKASETVSKHSVTYVREQGSSKESEMAKLAMMYLDGTTYAYQGV